LGELWGDGADAVASYGVGKAFSGTVAVWRKFM